MIITLFDFNGIRSIQQRLLDEGNTVYLCFNSSFLSKPLYNVSDSYGLQNADNFHIVMSKVDVEKAIGCSNVIIYEGSRPSKRLSSFLTRMIHTYKKPIINYASEHAFAFEKCRYYAKGFDTGFDNYKTYICKSYKEFKKLNLKELFVIKAVNEDSILINSDYRTIVPKSFEELDSILKNDTYHHFKSGGAVLEEYIKGTELAFGFYWDGNNIVGNSVLVNQEYKGVWNNDLGGILCGESGTAFRYTNLCEFNPRFHAIMTKCVNHFRRHFSDYKGLIDINTIFNEDFSKVYLMEYTVRAGFPTSTEVCHTVKNYTNFISSLAFGTPYTDGYTSEGVNVGVCMYPYGTPIKNLADRSYLPINGTVDNNIHMQYGIIKNNKYYFSNWDRTLIAISSGSTALKANEKALKSLNKLSCWNLVYRSDIGSKWSSVYSKVFGDQFVVTDIVTFITSSMSSKNTLKSILKDSHKVRSYTKLINKVVDGVDYFGCIVKDLYTYEVVGILIYHRHYPEYIMDIDILFIKEDYLNLHLEDKLFNYVNKCSGLQLVTKSYLTYK